MVAISLSKVWAEVEVAELWGEETLVREMSGIVRKKPPLAQVVTAEGEEERNPEE